MWAPIEKRGEKKRKNYLASNFNCPVGKWGKKCIKKTLHVRHVMRNERTKERAQPWMYVYTYPVKLRQPIIV